jgi:ParE toxin of type II toxin-antitoxin system, parDE
MSFNLLVKEEAIADIYEIANWYNEQKNNLGFDFLSELELTFKAITKNPSNYQIQKKKLRQILLNRFPYVAVFEIIDNDVIVYGVIHCKRNPKVKTSRKK